MTSNMPGYLINYGYSSGDAGAVWSLKLTNTPLMGRPCSQFFVLSSPTASPYTVVYNSRVLSTEEPPQCFAVAFLDRSRRPETELWIFLSGQVPGRCNGLLNEGSTCPPCNEAVLATLRHISTLPRPEPVGSALDPPTENGTTDTPSQDEHLRHRDSSFPVSSYLSHLAYPSILLLGAAHNLPVRILEQANLIRTEWPGIGIPYLKYVFRLSDLPRRARSAIPRTQDTIMRMPSVAVFSSSSKDEGGSNGETLVAWAFMGLDGSLTALHVEADFRGRGLAKAVVGRLFREHLKVFGEVGLEEEGWAHSDVAVENWESRGVAKSLGGTEGWEVFWVRVDLERLEG
ncbi:hypothetical protein H2199_001271 [Coniosporium tulheliwenetii]|uniref:Uncharacterized protein n=1 Tax=Coniosporium tulheliwenetii TaxID=3383036 RepID=A0ACC2ZLR9_9PEZI|nr:hypothetical protein H2199_001271 [Cladosporium sp. JES 115]